ncbi:MAG TPA: FAD-dependent oxidoreductase [Patescibacteria group bacterium]|nr:FAD-dependent oxidoreductase [Patescibacteria group bacterium]
MNHYVDVSYWLETAGDLTPRPRLDGTTDCDVAILGAGYTGLWTAYYLLERQPGLRVVIAESEIAGFGASGRNGAWCAPDLNISMERLAHLHGPDAARRIQQATYDAVDEVGRVAAAEGIEAGFHKGGELIVARGPQHVPAIEAALRYYERFGFGEHYRLLDGAGVAEKVRIAGAVAGLWSGTAAIVHPGQLVRGLAALVERMGARIVEQTPVSDFRAAVSGPAGAAPAALITPRGEIRAPVVVLAGEAYLTRLAKLHRQLVAIYSLIVLTEPISDELWDEIGWADREVVASARLSIDYLSRTADGRILFGGRGAPYRLGSPIKDAYDRHDPTHEMLRGFVRTWFPMLRDVRFTHAWGGPLGMPRDWHPSFAFDPRSGIASARGYVGHGVSTANLAGRTLADLITGEKSPLTELPLVNHRSPNWEVEPFRWLGIRYVQGALSRLDRRSEATGRPPTGRSLAERIANH